MAAFEPVLTRNVGRPAARTVAGYREGGGYEGLAAALKLEPDAVIEAVKASGLRGRGGAGFPCGMKWSFIPKGKGSPKYIVCNADESEPGTFKDRMLIEFDPHSMLEGIAIACYATHCDTAYVYIRGEYHHETEILEHALAETYKNNIFGDKSILGDVNGRKLNCYVHRGAGAYICGEETGLLESLEGKRGWPRIKPPFPAVKGLFGRPTVINNVETLCCLPPILEHGAAWFKSIGTPSHFGPHAPGNFGPKLYGVSGHVQKPGVYEEALGIRMSELIEKYCGGMRGGKRYKAAIPGGVSMGFLGPDQYEANLDFDIGRRFNVLGLGTAGVIVMDESTDIVAMTRNIVRFFSHESCGQCTPCREGTGWMYQMLCRIEAGDGRTKDIDLLDELARSMGAMPGTTICGLADGANWAVKTAIEKFRPEFEARCRPTLVQIGVVCGQE